MYKDKYKCSCRSTVARFSGMKRLSSSSVWVSELPSGSHSNSVFAKVQSPVQPVHTNHQRSIKIQQNKGHLLLCNKDTYPDTAKHDQLTLYNFRIQE